MGKAQACPPLSKRGKVGTAQARLCPLRVQSNKLDTDSSEAVRPMASAIREAIDSVRILGALRTASVGWIESVMTSSFNLEAVGRAPAPPRHTPWLLVAYTSLAPFWRRAASGVTRA